MGKGFSAGEESWRAGLGTLRQVVRQELVTRQLAAHLTAGRPMRVLDVGCGQGTQVLALARAGHRVTGLDASATLLGDLETALAGEAPEVRGQVRLVHGEAERLADLVPSQGFDAVLCHGVLMYFADPAPLLTAVAAAVAPGGFASLLVRNGDALAMRPGLLGHWPTAQRAFDDMAYGNRIGLTARADRLARPDRFARGAGAVGRRLVRRAGVHRHRRAGRAAARRGGAESAAGLRGTSRVDRSISRCGRACACHRPADEQPAEAGYLGMRAGQLPLDEQMNRLRAALDLNRTLGEVLSGAAAMNLPGWYLVAGCLYQTVWNVITGQPPEAGILDYDLVYFDASDLSWEAEDAVIRAGNEVFAGLAAPVQIRNQARVHLWYEQKFGLPCPPHASSEAAIDTYEATVACLGVRLDSGGRWRIYAPYGLSDVFNLVIRPNPVLATRDVYDAKTARWTGQWPGLTVFPWPATIDG